MDITNMSQNPYGYWTASAQESAKLVGEGVRAGLFHDGQVEQLADLVVGWTCFVADLPLASVR